MLTAIGGSTALENKGYGGSGTVGLKLDADQKANGLWFGLLGDYRTGRRYSRYSETSWEDNYVLSFPISAGYIKKWSKCSLGWWVGFGPSFRRSADSYGYRDSWVDPVILLGVPLGKDF